MKAANKMEVNVVIVLVDQTFALVVVVLVADVVHPVLRVIKMKVLQAKTPNLMLVRILIQNREKGLNNPNLNPKREFNY